MEKFGWLVVVGFSCFGVCFAVLRNCVQDDYHYEYTVCDTENQRWRVSVPGQGVCTPVGENAPVKANDCDAECPEGNYMDMGVQQCKPCSAGTYSLGGSIKFDEWNELPSEFHVVTEAFSSYSFGDDVNCSRNAWKPQGGFVSAIPGDCTSTLIFSGSLKKPGYIKFEYQYPEADSVAIFHVTVQNNRCQSSSDKKSSKWPSVTSEGKWEEETLELNSGFNVVNFRVIGVRMDGDNSGMQQVLIRKITVSGVAFSSECTKCAAGTYSSDGAKYCTPCDPNTYSEHGARLCKPCDAASQYSKKGATKCLDRPPCKDSDYYIYQTPCDENRKTKTVSSWIEPRICRTDALESVKLPPDGELHDCAACGPGMHLVNNTCEFCPPNQYSLGQKCQPCPVSTSPDYGYQVRSWNTMPSFFTATCVSFEDNDCNNDTKWLPFGDHIVTHFARGESAYLVLQLKVGGFRTTSKASDGSSMVVGQVSFEFETTCPDGYCQLVLLSDETGSQELIKAWEGTLSKQTYVYDVTKNRTVKFTWAFQNSGWMNSDDYSNSTAKIYGIKVTNTLAGGAEMCQGCPKGSNDDGCIPCPDGHYIDPSLITCVKCPPKTVVYSHNAYGADSCKKCGEGLQAYKGRVCMSDGLFVDSLGREYDLRNLSGHRIVTGSMLFTSSGTKFFHGFNISMFGDPETSRVICSNNVSQSDQNVHDDGSEESNNITRAIHEPNKVQAMICRSTLVPADDNTGDVVATQSASLGDHLVKIVWNETSAAVGDGSDMNVSSLYAKSGFDASDIEDDIQLHFASTTPTRACPSGRHSVVSLRCDLDEKGNGTIHLPPNCADGTCDGCTFHFMWRTRVACPVCRKEDFSRVVGECVKGTQTIHYFPPAHCIVRDKLEKLEETQKCRMNLSALPMIVQIAVPAVVVLAAILFLCLCFVWRKNKKLEYKYIKLVENSSGNEGDLPGVDSCALEEGEYDEQGDAVQIRDSKGARFFKKLKNKISKDDDAFDTTMMNERMPLT